MNKFERLFLRSIETHPDFPKVIDLASSSKRLGLTRQDAINLFVTYHDLFDKRNTEERVQALIDYVAAVHRGGRTVHDVVRQDFLDAAKQVDSPKANDLILAAEALTGSDHAEKENTTVLIADTVEGTLALDLPSGIAYTPLLPKPSELTPTEALLLVCLMKAGGGIVLNKTFHYARYGVPPTHSNEVQWVKTQINHLRNKLGETSERKLIRNSPHRGYALLCPEEAKERAYNLIDTDSNSDKEPIDVLQVDIPGGYVRLVSQMMTVFSSLTGREERVTPLECRILEILLKNKNRAVSLARLISYGRGELVDDGIGSEYLVKTHITHIRKKIGDNPNIGTRLGNKGYAFGGLIRNVHKSGYLFCALIK